MAELEAHQRNTGYLLTASPLTEAEGWLATKPEDLSKDDSDYIRAGRRRAELRNRAVQSTVAAVILALTAFGGMAWWQWQRALEQEVEAVAAAEEARAA